MSTRPLLPLWPHARAWSQAHPRLLLLLAIALGAGIAAWLLTRQGALFGPQDGTWHRMQINRDFYVGLDPNYPPFATWTPTRIEGFEADLARAIGDRLGVRTSILIMGYDGLYDALYTGSVDLLIAGLTVDPAQREWVYYSRPYFDAGQVLVSRADAAFKRIEALDGKRLAVELASAGDSAAQRWARRLGALTVMRALLPEDAMAAVLSGQADAALVDTVSARLYVRSHPMLVLADHTTVPEPYVIAMRRGDFRLIAAVEEALRALEADGSLDALIAAWF